MARIIGNIEPQDDYTHELGPEKNFNESVYFNFFDRTRNLGGFLRMGNRANEGHAEMTVIVYNPDGSAYFNYKRPEITSNDGWDAGGLRVEVLEPTERLRTLYQGSVVFLKNPREMADPKRAFTENPHRDVSIDLLHEAAGPLYGRAGSTGEGSDFARAHFEQHMKVSGTIRIANEDALEIQGHGLRDHSWGPRYWQSTPSYRWITGNFGDDLGLVVSIVGERKGGVFYRGDEFHLITDLDLETEYEEGTNFHRSLRAEFKLSNGEEHTLEGTVKGFIPLRNRRSGTNTHIGEGMTEYTLDGEHVGYGLSEYLDQPRE